MQVLAVAVLVFSSFVYAAWILCPKGPRSRLAAVLLKWPLPPALQKPLLTASRRGGGCGCDGCDKPATQSAKPVTLVRGNYAGKIPR